MNIVSFQSSIETITSLVSLVVTTASTSFSKDLSLSRVKEDGEMCISELQTCIVSMNQYGQEMVKNGELFDLRLVGSKSIKQNLASSSYDIAKFVKELIGIVEHI